MAPTLGARPAPPVPRWHPRTATVWRTALIEPSAEPIAAVLFDLDGTLVDTAPDLGGALNRVIEERGFAPLPAETIRPHVSRGGRGLTELGYAHYDLGPDRDATRHRLLDLYEAHLCVDSALFPGMDDVLDALEARGMPWGIVTNKLTYLTTPLVAALGLDVRAACVVCGDTVEHAKPHPAPLEHAATLVGRPASACLYVGDDLRDVQAARAAGMPVLAAGYGYLGPAGDPTLWGADGVITAPSDLLAYLPVT